jgi:hypothetical protein
MRCDAPGTRRQGGELLAAVVSRVVEDGMRKCGWLAVQDGEEDGSARVGKRAGRVVNPEQANRGSRSLEKKATTAERNRRWQGKASSARKRRVAGSGLRRGWSRWPATENCRLGHWGAEQRRWAQGRAGDGGRRRREREKWNRRGGRQDGISATDGMRCQWTLFSAARPRRHCGFRLPQARSAPLPQSCSGGAGSGSPRWGHATGELLSVPDRWKATASHWESRPQFPGSLDAP